MNNELLFQIENEIEALRTELYAAPDWRQGTTWYSDRVERLHALYAKKAGI